MANLLIANGLWPLVPWLVVAGLWLLNARRYR